MTLTEILRTDKVLLNCGDLLTDKGTTHSYIEAFYESAFLPYKKKDIELFEIGISGGSCLYLWKRYFENSKRIIGADIRPGVIGEQFKNLSGVEHFYENAYTSEFASKIPDLDIAIDDGSHRIEDQLRFIEIYGPKLKTGGLLVIEDIHEPSYPDCRTRLEEAAKSLGSSFESKWYDLRSVKNRPDDQVIAIWRR